MVKILGMVQYVTVINDTDGGNQEPLHDIWTFLSERTQIYLVNHSAYHH